MVTFVSVLEGTNISCCITVPSYDAVGIQVWQNLCHFSPASFRVKVRVGALLHLTLLSVSHTFHLSGTPVWSGCTLMEQELGCADQEKTLPWRGRTLRHITSALSHFMVLMCGESRN